MNTSGGSIMVRITEWIRSTPLSVLALAIAAQASAATLTLDVSNVHSSQGRVMLALCGDSSAAIPGACTTYSAMAAAKQGAMSVRIENITPGRYAIQAFHDENSNFRPDM